MLGHSSTPRFGPVAIAFVMLFSTIGLAGCLGATPDTEVSIVSIARIVTVDIDETTFDDAPAIEKILKTHYEIRTVGASYDASLLTLTYTDNTGTVVSKTLKAITNQAELVPGAPLVVSGVDFSSAATLKLGEQSLATRGPVPMNSWEVGGVPVGFSMDPGSTMKYTVESRGVGEFSLADYAFTMGEGPDAQAGNVKRLAQIFDVRQTGALEVVVKGATESVTPEDGSAPHTAYPADWSFSTAITVPSARMDATGTFDGDDFDVGAEILGMAFSGNVFGKLWVDEAKRVVRIATEGGKSHAEARAVAWYEGIPSEYLETAPCPQATRASPCDLEDFNKEFPIDEDATIMSADMDPTETVPDDEGFDAYKRILQSDMATGDAFRFRFAYDANNGNPVEPGSGAPETARVEFRFNVEVGKLTDVTTGAGTMRAWELTETTSLKADVSTFENEEFSFAGFKLNEEPLRTTIYLAETTFAPVKVVFDAPFDMEPIVRRILEAVKDETWQNLPGTIPRPENYRMSAEGGGSLTLENLVGDVNFQPWAGLGYAHVLSAASGLAIAAIGSPFGRSYASEVPDPQPVPPYGDLRLHVVNAARGDQADMPSEGFYGREFECASPCDLYTIWVNVVAATGESAEGAMVTAYGYGFGNGIVGPDGLARIVINTEGSSPSEEYPDGTSPPPREPTKDAYYVTLQAYHDDFGESYSPNSLVVYVR